MYSRTSTGAVQQWTIEIQGDSYRTVHGQVDGKLQTTEWTVAKPTNVGKANERLGPAQAQFEAKATWKKKKDSGYHENIQDIDTPRFIEPMLAQKYEDRKDGLVYPVWVQPKLDGIRCICSARGMTSRNGKPLVAAPHIMEELADFFAKHPDAVLDGELYCDKLNNDFDKICSLVKKSKPTKADLAEAALTIEYHVYDLIDLERTFAQRMHWLEVNLFHIHTDFNSVIDVDTYTVDSEEMLDELYGRFVEAGYEGQMIRTDGKYEQKRSKNLLKRKEFQDAEYEILDICEGEGNRSGTAGYAVLHNPGTGESFRSNIKGNRAFVTRLLKERAQVIGKPATVQFFNLTPAGVPRFPFVIAIRDYE